MKRGWSRFDGLAALLRRQTAQSCRPRVVRLSGVHALLESVEARELGGEAEDGRQPVRSRAHEDRRVVPSEPSPADGRTVSALRAEASGALRVLWRYWQLALLVALPVRGGAF